DRNSFFPSDVIAIPIARDPFGSWTLLTTLNVPQSTTLSSSADSDGTYASLLSGENTMFLGLGGTANRPTTFLVATSTAKTSPLVSHDTYAWAPSGRTATPSGSFPIGTMPRTLPVSASVMLIVATSSFAMNSCRPSPDTANC